MICLSAPAMDRATAQVAMRSVDLPTGDLVYDARGGLIYASVPGRAGPPQGNHIVWIDPERGLVAGGIPAASEPDRLALADDGSVLYVATRGNNQVIPIDLRERAVGTPFAIGESADRVDDMAVVPGNSWALVVSRNPGPGASRNRGLAVFVNGQPLPVTVSGPVNAITFDDSASTLYGHNSGTSPHNDLETFRIDLSPGGGLVRVKQTNGVFELFQDCIVYSGGRIYSQRGDIVDPLRHSRIGRFPIPFGLHPFTADSANRSLFYLVEEAIAVFDRNIFVQRAEIPLPGVSDVRGSLIRWGERGLAFRTDDAVLLLESDSVRNPSGGFQRGDANGDGLLDGSDVVFSLVFQFRGTVVPECIKSLDCDDDGLINVTDPVHLLAHLFLGKESPAPPFRQCGFDETPDGLSCEGAASCR